MIYKMFSEGYYECNGRVLNKMDYRRMNSSNGRLAGVVEYAMSLHGKQLRDIDPNAPGDVEGQWCAWFVSHCFEHEGLIPSVLEYSSWGCTSWWQDFLSKGKAKRKEEYTPQTGDIIFYDGSPRNSGYSGHVGIVVECDGSIVHTIEGNTYGGGSGSICWDHEYSVTYDKILGYYMASQF